MIVFRRLKQMMIARRRTQSMRHITIWVGWSVSIFYLIHGKLFIGRPSKIKADNLLKLSKHQLKMVTAIYTGNAPVRGHLYTMGPFDGDPICIFCGMETETMQHIICRSEALDRQRYNVFGRPTVEPKDISTASVRHL